MSRPVPVGLSLQIDESTEFGEDSLANMDSTFRAEGMSVNNDRLRVDGITVGERLRDQLKMGRKLGSGACSSVYYAEHMTTRRPYAVKIFNLYDRMRREQLISELAILTSQDCETLVKFHSAYMDSGQIGVIIEYMDFGSLDILMKSGYRISEPALAAIAFQILWGLGYLHHDGNLHRDIKPGNVLMNSFGECKISDFGISTQLQGPESMSDSVKGSFRYMSPERLLGLEYNASADIWSVAIMLMQLYRQQYPFAEAASTPVELSSEFEEINIRVFLAQESYPPIFAAFLESILRYAPIDRPSAQELLGYAWFQDFGIISLDAAVQILHDWVRSFIGGSDGPDDSAGGYQDDFDESDYTGGDADGSYYDEKNSDYSSKYSENEGKQQDSHRRYYK